MDVARINCAHDDAPAWTAMASYVRRAAAASGRNVKVLMDLAGPKMRTGPIAAGPAVLKIKPRRDDYGRLTHPALAGLRAVGSRVPVFDAGAVIEVDPLWLEQLRAGDRIDFVDARAADRRMTVIDERAECVMLNKGAHILEAIRTLDDVLRRMQSHQAKKRPLMRALKSWNLAGAR